MKNVQSNTQSLDEIMRSARFEIPYNQRPYTWTKTNWELLWDSFFSDTEKATFLGSVIFLSPEKIAEAKQVFDVCVSVSVSVSVSVCAHENA